MPVFWMFVHDLLPLGASVILDALPVGSFLAVRCMKAHLVRLVLGHKKL